VIALGSKVHSEDLLKYQQKAAARNNMKIEMPSKRAALLYCFSAYSAYCLAFFISRELPNP